MAATAFASASAVTFPVRGVTTNQRKLHIAASSTPSTIPQRSRIFPSVGFFAGVVDSSDKLVKSAPQCGQISVAWLISYSHSRQVTMASRQDSRLSLLQIYR